MTQQGHSVEIEPGHPPAVLFHGAVAKYLAAIRKEGLTRGKRSHVHLSAQVATAEKVGEWRGQAIVLEVLAAGMAGNGRTFYLTPNGMWLTGHVPPRYLRFPSGG